MNTISNKKKYYQSKLVKLFERYGVFQRKEDKFIKEQYTKELIEEIINLFGLEIVSKSVMTPFPLGTIPLGRNKRILNTLKGV